MRPMLTAAVLFAAASAPAAAAPAQTIAPGMWSIATTLDDVQMQGPMAGMGSMLKGRTTTLQHCVTPEEAARGPAEAANANAKRNCTYARQSIAGGHISVEATCRRGATTEQMAEDGEYGPNGFHLKARAVASGGSMPMTMDMTIVGARTGDCK